MRHFQPHRDQWEWPRLLVDTFEFSSAHFYRKIAEAVERRFVSRMAEDEDEQQPA